MRPCGYSTIGTSTGSLSDTTFELGGTTYTIAAIEETALSDFLTFTVTSTLGTTSTSGLKLHVCDATPFEFSSAAHTVTTGRSTYRWTSSGLDWSTVTTRHLYLSTVDTRAPVLTRATVDGSTLTLTYDERLKVTSPTRATTSEFILVANTGGAPFVISEIEAGIGPSGQNVTMTITPPARHGEQVAISYNGGNATEATRIQDLAGNDAPQFVNHRAENLTPDRPSLDTIGFAGAAGPYGAGETIAIDAVFTESVTVTGRPEVEIEVGVERRKALWKTGQAPGTTQRFEYTVQTGELDESGPDILLNGLKTPTGSTITTTDDCEAVLLEHRGIDGRAERYVDAVAPGLAVVADGGPVQVMGPTITVQWNELLDEASVPAPGSFTVTVTPLMGTAQTRTVSEVDVTGTVLTLTLDRVTSVTASEVTLSYTVPSVKPLRDLAGNNAKALNEQAVTVVGATSNAATGRFTFENSVTGAVGESVRIRAQIADADGIAAGTTFSYKLLRVEGSTETEIGTGSTNDNPFRTPARMLIADDAGKRLKLEVSFTDFGGNEETVTSEAWPNDPIAWNQSTCAMPSEIVSGSRHLVWTADMTLGTFTDSGGMTAGYAGTHQRYRGRP